MARILRSDPEEVDITSPILFARMHSDIARLNDAFRTTLNGPVFLTQAVAALPEPDRAAIVRQVQEFSVFTEDNDPRGEHDFGAVEHGGRKIFWKIDYYDRTLVFGSPDPADPAETVRVLTIMFADEY